MPRDRTADVLHEAGLVADPAQANNVIDGHRRSYPPALDAEVLEPLHLAGRTTNKVAACT